ncbi:hypothetical protein Sru01_37780 [Sphaerisporangium rufum]|uniref:Uncharacterized protein n=1 Tax=Sphaerisporangium rufum TaxID=1381558 RepID=A0A919R5J5_9ACTN|nr:hypothetical protein [Sphaerisporangium rufum]GII78796.1 hypothetical protein Sru01_37780 [Sphaerisporangium rufum]
MDEGRRECADVVPAQGRDAGMEAGRDAGMEAGRDGVEAGRDGGVDAAVDEGVDEDEVLRLVERHRREATAELARLDEAVHYRDEAAIEHLTRSAAARILGLPAGETPDVDPALVRAVWNWLAAH